MKHADFVQWLIKHNACLEVVAWVRKHGYDAVETWNKLDRADWLMWYATRETGNGWPTHQQIVLAACDCAATARKYVPAGEIRPAAAIRVARRWARGKATIEQVFIATWNAAWATWNAAWAALDGGDSAWAAGTAAEDAARAVWAAGGAVWAAWAAGAALAAGDARDAAHITMCRLIRKRLTCPFAAEGANNETIYPR